MNKKQSILVIVSFLLLAIISINYQDNIEKSNRESIKKYYFTNLSLYIKGKVCNIEQQYDTHKLLITLNVLKSNQKEYTETVLNTTFCYKKYDLAIFADHHSSYEVGDIVSIGKDSIDLITCEDILGNHKFSKKRSEGMLYYIAPPTKRMVELLELGCRN